MQETEKTPQTTPLEKPSREGFSISDLLWLPLTVAGCVLLAFANKTPDAVLTALLFLLPGVLVNLLFFGKHERRAFLLTYGACVFVAGLAQHYSLAVFGMIQTTTDAWTFFNFIAPEPPFTRFADVSGINAPLAVVIWQQVYALAWRVGFVFGPYAGILCNAMTVGLAGSVAVRAAREIFGNDERRLRRVGTLFACCGMFWLYGALFLRDGFALLLNTVALWMLVRWLSRPGPRRLAVAAAVIGCCGFIMWYIRPESAILFGIFGFLAFLCWYWRARRSLAHLLATALIPIFLLIGYAYLEEYLVTVSQRRAKSATGYAGLAQRFSREDSLGMSLIIHQPLPVRLVVGSGSMMVFPVPLWGYFSKGRGEYHLIKGVHGIYQVLIFPLFFLGIWISLREVFRSRKEPTPTFFLAVYSVMNLLAVAATSLETRHLGQFLPAFLILCAVPDSRKPAERMALGRVSWGWFSLVILGHLAWALARF